MMYPSFLGHVGVRIITFQLNLEESLLHFTWTVPLLVVMHAVVYGQHDSQLPDVNLSF